jgi:hypothetical protein
MKENATLSITQQSKIKLHQITLALHRYRYWYIINGKIRSIKSCCQMKPVVFIAFNALQINHKKNALQEKKHVFLVLAHFLRNLRSQ